MQQDQVMRGEDSMSDYDSAAEEAMAGPRDYLADDYSNSDDSSDRGELDDEAMEEECAFHKAHWAKLRALQSVPGYEPGSPVRKGGAGLW